MRLTSIRLHPFGKFLDTSWDLSDPLVVISGPNETGKSTLRQAIFHSLFTPTDLTPSRLRTLIAQWLPLPVGDYAAITIDIDDNGKNYQLKKRWGSQPTSHLTTPDGSALSDTETIARILEKLCGHNEATFRHVFFTGHDELENTITKLQANSLELRDIRSLVQAGNETAGDIDQRIFEDLLDQRIKKYFSRWDDERQRPIRQNGQEKSVGNEWKQSVGEILGAWYTWQVLIAEQKTILRIEKDIDAITSQLITIEEQVKKDQKFISTFGPLRDQLSERSVMEERVSRLTGERELLKKVFAAWPIAHAAVDAWKTQRDTLVVQSKNLNEELRTARLREQADDLLNHYHAIQSAEKELQEAQDAIKKQHPPEPARLFTIETLHDEITHLENVLAAQSLTYSMTSNSTQLVMITHSDEPPEQRDVQEIPVTGTASGRIRFESSGLIITVDSGGQDVEEILQNLQQKRTSLRLTLESCGVSTIAEAKEQASFYNRLVLRTESKQETYRALLRGKSRAEWDTQFAEIEGLRKTRDSETIEHELEAVRHSVSTGDQSLKTHQERIQSWEKSYINLESLGENLLTAQHDLRTTETTLTTLPHVPSKFPSSDAFIHSLDSAQERMNTNSEPRSTLASQRGGLEGQLGDRRSEDLVEEAENAKNQFDHVLDEGNSYKRIKEMLTSIDPIDNTSLDEFNERVSEIFSTISSSDSQLRFLDTLPSHITRGTITVSPERLSQGARGALALAVRLALAELYLKSASGFVMLDDPLVHLDKERLGEAISILKSFSKRYPVIFFTCHEQQADLLRA